MGAINVLPKNIAELIAAGEVIERPASVIKELVENSIDSGAKSICVEIRRGGVTYMRVTDDGCGIERDDVKNAFLRHATSKISAKDDLDAIATLGFRGEALASVCAVSRVELLTKNENEQDGTRYVIEGGEEKSFDIIGCPKGTTFIARDIFYNVPARMKFLKKDVTEGNAVSAMLERIALSHPEISFTFIRDGKQTIKTQGDGKLGNAVFQVFGKEFYNTLIPVSYSGGRIKISGFISKPVSSVRANRNMQMFYINGRYVRSKTAMAALEQAYKGSIMAGKFPSCVLLMEMNCSSLDVNVHPAKLEVRFTNEAPVFDSVYHAVRSAVMTYDTRNEPPVRSEVRFTSPQLLAKPADRGKQLGISAAAEPPAAPPVLSPADDDEPEIYIPPKPYQESVCVSDEPMAIPSAAQITKADLAAKFGYPAFSQEEEKPSAPALPVPELSAVRVSLPENEDILADIAPDPEAKPEPILRYIGEAFRTYIIIEYDENRLMFIDKHAAHERLIYERLKKEGRGKNAQLLLEPVSVTLDNEECRIILENKELLSAAGFEVDGFGEKTILVRSTPVMLEKEDIMQSFTEIADHLCRHRRLKLSEQMEWIYANTACRAAVKAGNVNDPQELIALAKALEENPEIRYCPHGRPIYFFLSKKELEKSFGRIQ